jgi:hypothetical protein
MKLVTKGRPYTPLSVSLQPLHPFCNVCGWRKGGIDSWDGSRCKCGDTQPVIECDADWEESTGFFVNVLNR